MRVGPVGVVPGPVREGMVFKVRETDSDAAVSI